MLKRQDVAILGGVRDLEDEHVLARRRDREVPIALAGERPEAAGDPPALPEDASRPIEIHRGSRIDDAIWSELASFISETGPDTLAFRHALLREAVYDDLLAGERLRTHAALARALADRPDCVVICTDHSAFHYDELVATGVVIVDTRNALKDRTSSNIFRL